MVAVVSGMRPVHLRAVLLASVAFGLMGGPLVAAEIEAKSRIAAVTVYPEGAMVTRTVVVDLPAGSTTLVFRGLPLSIDPASLRVEGQASGKLVLGSVESRLQPVDPAKAGSDIEARVRPLKEERDRRAAVLDALEGRKAMIQRFGQSGPERGASAAPLDVAQWSAAWEAVGAALVKINGELLAARAAFAEVDNQIKALEAAETQRRTRNAPEREFTLALEAGEPLKGQLTLSYRVTGAQWRPAYDARLETGAAGRGATLRLTRRALVTQKTGEDWGDIALTISTLRVLGSTAAPDVHGQRVSYIEYPMPVPMAAARAKVMAEQEADMSARGGARRAPAPAAAPPAMQVAEREATVESNDFQATFQIPGVLTVPKDGSQKSFAIQSRDLLPDLMIRSAPALDPTAYLQAAFVNEEDAPLIAGEIALIRDGMFVGRGRMAYTPPGERVTVGFGADDRVKVSRVPLRRRETEPGIIGSTKSDIRDFRIMVRNLHDFPIKTQIIDQIPYSEAANLSVEPLSTNTAATEKTIDDRRGVMGWTFDLKPKEERDIRLGYRLRWPSDREVRFDRIVQQR